MNRTRVSRLFYGLFGLLLFTGCASLLEPHRWERVVGVIDIGGEISPSPIQVPDVVQKGVPFTATVVTYGSGTCTRGDGAEVQVTNLTAEITPYDLEARGEVICTDDLVPYPRTVTLRFDTVGEAVVRVLGRPLNSDAPVQYETRISVQP